MMKKLILALLSLLACAGPAHAQLDGPRVDHPLPQNTNVVSVTYIDADANAAFTVPNRIEPELDIDSNIFVLGYTRSQPILGRTVHWQVLLPVGRIESTLPLPLTDYRKSTKGIGDLTLGATINLTGAPALPVREAIRHDLDLTVGFGAQITIPIGAYDSDQILNLGSNQWNARLSLPIIKSLGDWVPGRRMTLEVKPAVRFFGDNSDSLGMTIEQDPIYSVEAHLTRDMTTKAFISLDYSLLAGGDQKYFDNSDDMLVREQDRITTHLLGGTISYKVNDNLTLFVGHHQTLGGQSDKIRLDATITKVQLVWAWHPVLEQRKNFLN